MPKNVDALKDELAKFYENDAIGSKDLSRIVNLCHFDRLSTGRNQFTTALKSGALRHDIHYWLGKDTSQPCIIAQEGGVASGFKHVEAEEHQTRLFVCKGKHVIQVKEVPFARSSLNHDDIFILDTTSKIFKFNGSNSSIQERAKALEVVQYIKDTYHDGKCEIAAIEDGRLMADAETGEFWGFFGGFAPLPRKTAANDLNITDAGPSKLFCVEKGEALPIEADSLTRDLLDTHKCFILDCGVEVFIWMGRNTSLNQRKAASSTVDELLRGQDRAKSHVSRVIEGFETVTFRSKFNSWPQTVSVTVSEEGRGKVAALIMLSVMLVALLKRQGLNVKGLLKAETPKEETQLYIDCTGDLKVWRVNGQQRTLLSGFDQSKFYSGDCYIFQYSYPGEDKDEHLIGTWFGKHSIEVCIHEGNEPLQFFAIFQSFILFKGGLSKGYKNHISEKELEDDTYSADGLALFRVQGSGPENMQAIQVDPVASSLNSSYCYILHSGSSIFIWTGNLTSSEAQELAERQLDLIRPNSQSKLQKEGAEIEQFWDLLGGKSEYPSQKIARKAESDPHIFSCTLTKGDLKVTEVHNFNQDDLMTEDIFILDCQSDIYVWVGQHVESKNKMNASSIGEKFLERDFLHENLSLQTPIYIVNEGGEPTFFTRFFSWDSSKSAMHGNSFQRKLAILKHGGTPVVDVSYPSTILGPSHGTTIVWIRSSPTELLVAIDSRGTGKDGDYEFLMTDEGQKFVRIGEYFATLCGNASRCDAVMKHLKKFVSQLPHMSSNLRDFGEVAMGYLRNSYHRGKQCEVEILIGTWLPKEEVTS
ncbi:villin [Striga asiatica]|uniref:Villin n=1 Tax=Striga asiatica TaxID=4170 RepID=A0A5A7PT87_STRAF|nr:villin [Striga asiatica]